MNLSEKASVGSVEAEVSPARTCLHVLSAGALWPMASLLLLYNTGLDGGSCKASPMRLSHGGSKVVDQLWQKPQSCKPNSLRPYV